MLFLGYDPGGAGTHGVAAVMVAPNGQLSGEPVCQVLQDARSVIEWVQGHSGASALGIDTLLTWSARGGRVCDNRLRSAYRLHASTVIAQNALYSSMTLNGAIVARAAVALGLPLFESHPKLLVKIAAAGDPEAIEILDTHSRIKNGPALGPSQAKRADDMADAVVAAWCAARGFYGNWATDLYKLGSDNLGDDSVEFVAGRAIYPWPEEV